MRTTKILAFSMAIAALGTGCSGDVLPEKTEVSPIPVESPATTLPNTQEQDFMRQFEDDGSLWAKLGTPALCSTVIICTV